MRDYNNKTKTIAQIYFSSWCPYCMAYNPAKNGHVKNCEYLKYLKGKIHAS